MGKTGKRILTCLAALALAVALVWGGWWYVTTRYCNWEGTLFRRDARTLTLQSVHLSNLQRLSEFPELETVDLRNAGAEPWRYDAICREMPEYKILWDLPFQGKAWPLDTEKITVSSLTEEEMELLDYLHSLAVVDGWDCPDYEAMAALQQRRPECKVFYFVPLGEARYPCEASELAARDVTLAELEEKLPHFPRAKSLCLSGALPGMEQIRQLQRDYPQLEITWQVTVGDMELNQRIAYLNLGKEPFPSAREAAGILSYFPELEQVNFLGSDLPKKELRALTAQFPEVTFLYDVDIAGVTVRTDAETLVLSGRPLSSVAELEDWLPSLTGLRKVEMCGCGISNEEMDALSKRWPDIRFIWSIDFGGILLRTDARYFAPNKWGIDVDDEMAYPLRYCVDMVCVDVGHMKKMTNCDWAAFMPKLKYLILADSNIQSVAPLEGLENLVFLELFLTPIRDYRALTSCTALEDINLSYTYGDPAPIGEMPWLKRVWWAQNWQARALLPQKLPDAELEFDQPSSTGGTWRKGKHYYDMRDFIGMGYMEG